MNEKCIKADQETVADLRSRQEGAMPPLREEKGINKVHKLL